MVLADILRTVKREAPIVFATTFLLIFGTLWALLGSLRKAIVGIIPAAASLVLLGGLLPVFGVELNYLNIVILPALLGIGVDGSVHILTHLETERHVAVVANQTGRAISGALLTTGFGFGVLALSGHAGLQSLGWLTMLGVAANWFACLVGLMCFVAIWRSHVPHAKHHFARVVSTVGFAGMVPRGGGTVGAVMALPIAVLWSSWPLFVRILGIVALTALSIYATHRFEKQNGSHDAKEVVVDELVGCLIALTFVPVSPIWMIAAFVGFRFFDIVKPWPISFIDRQKSSWAVIGDDVLAGIFAGGLMVAIRGLSFAT
jgi:phosphatidylglycerophosphatase A